MGETIIDRRTLEKTQHAADVETLNRRIHALERELKQAQEERDEARAGLRALASAARGILHG